MQAVAWAAAWDGEERRLHWGYEGRGSRQIMPSCKLNRLSQQYIQSCFLSMELCRVTVMSLARAARCWESPSQVEELSASFKTLL